MNILTIKDWLKERSEKQFEFIEPMGNWKRVRRLKDNVWFTEQQAIGYKGNLYTIEKFKYNMFSVLIKSTGSWGHKGFVDINELNK